MNQRTDWVDYGKGFAIILVVYAHLQSSGYHAGLKIQKHFFSLSDSLIYSFHMPLFFFLAGIFVEQSFLKRGPRKFLVEKLKKIAYPCLIWSLLQASAELMFSDHTHRQISINNVYAILYQPWSQFWFLYALMWMYLAYCIFNQLGKFSTGIMVLCASGLFFFPINTEITALRGFSHEFLFFVFGILLRKKLMTPDKKNIPFWLTIIAFIMLIGSGLIIFEKLISPTRLTEGSHPFYFLYLSTLGIISFIGLSQNISSIRKCQYIKIFGYYSFQIFLVHMLAGVGARVMLFKLFHIKESIIHIPVGVIIGLMAPVIIYKTAIKFNFPFLFEFKK